MIDIENKIIDTIATAMPGVTVYADFDLNPEEFPCVMVNYDYDGDLSRTFDNQLAPHHARIAVQIDCFDLNKDGAKALNNTAVDTMHSMKFTCTDSANWGRYMDGIYRYTSRFSAIVGEGVTEDGTTTFHMYRR